MIEHALFVENVYDQTTEIITTRARAACGHRSSELSLSIRPAKVTCKVCLRWVDKLRENK